MIREQREGGPAAARDLGAGPDLTCRWARADAGVTGYCGRPIFPSAPPDAGLTGGKGRHPHGACEDDLNPFPVGINVKVLLLKGATTWLGR